MLINACSLGGMLEYKMQASFCNGAPNSCIKQAKANPRLWAIVSQLKWTKKKSKGDKKENATKRKWNPNDTMKKNSHS